jgi:hypothetical protein
MPFTTAQFFGVFAAYNEGVWPAQAALLLAGLVSLPLLARTPDSRRFAGNQSHSGA